jgi:hypothetical protein
MSPATFPGFFSRSEPEERASIRNGDDAPQSVDTVQNTHREDIAFGRGIDSAHHFREISVHEYGRHLRDLRHRGRYLRTTGTWVESVDEGRVGIGPVQQVGADPARLQLPVNVRQTGLQGLELAQRTRWISSQNRHDRVHGINKRGQDGRAEGRVGNKAGSLD